MLSPSFQARQETAEFSVLVHTNALGLRGVEPSALVHPCLCILGDSFAFGHGVEDQETVASRLQVLTGLQVMNAGVMSYGTRQATGRLRQLSRVVRPDLCVLLFYAGNDLMDNIRPALTVRDGYVMNPAQELTPWRRLKLWIKYRSGLYRVAANLLSDPVIPDLCGNNPSFGFGAFRRTSPPEIERAWQATRDCLGELQELCESIGSKLVVVCIPTRFQVEDAWWERHKAQCNFDESEFDLRRVQAVLGAYCNEHGLPFLDPLDDFRVVHDSLYYQALLEMHLNPEGHARLAENLERFLRGQGIVPVK